MNFILPIILIISSFAVFFGYVNPNYKSGVDTNTADYSKADVIFLQSELAKYDDILTSATQIIKSRDALVAKRNTITAADQTRLETLLPSNIDNIRLILEISDIAKARNLITTNISTGDTAHVANGTIGQNNALYGTLSLKFTVNSSYSNFLNFLQDLENNLRLLDITDINFTSTDNGFYDFTVSLNTYWLK